MSTFGSTSGFLFAGLFLAPVALGAEPLPPLPEPLDLPAEKLERWIEREGLRELEADQVRHLTNVWVKAFQEYAAGVHDRCEPLMAETQRLPEGSEARPAKAMEVYQLYAAKTERQRDLVRRIRKLVKLRSDWPDRDPEEL